ncbi:MAG: DUF3987 domain-containing protein [Cyanobacteria bacterium J06639_14]
MKICQDTAIQQLKLLSYKAGDKVFLRSFYPSDDPRKKNDKGRKLSTTFPNLPWQIIESHQQEGRGVYLVVNGGGDTDSNVLECRAIFYEHDNLEKGLQSDLWKMLELPVPTFQIDTGGKSIHSYWVFKVPIPVAAWMTLQSDLLEFADADRSIKNPSRVMRLAGCHHLSPSRKPPAVLSKIISSTGTQYSFEELRSRIPRKVKQPEQSSWSVFDRDFRLLIQESLPLYVCLAKGSRDLIKNGAPEGTRNNSGAALARDLIGTANYLQAIGQRYQEEPEALFDQYCNRCSPPISESERDSIWRSAGKNNPGPSLSPEQIKGCIKGWAWRTQKSNEPAPKGAQVKAGFESELPKLSIEEARSRLEALVFEGMSESDVQAGILHLAEQTGKQSREIEKLYHATRHDIENSEDESVSAGEAATRLPDVIAARRAKLPIMKGLQGDSGKFALELLTTAKAMPIAPEYLVTALIPVLATSIGTSSRLIVNPAAGWLEKPIFWVLNVLRTGELKTPVLGLAKSGLELLEDIAHDDYQIALQQYEQEYSHFNSLSPSERQDTSPPTIPIRRRYILRDDTPQARALVHHENPRGLLRFRDEGSAFLSELGRFSHGRRDNGETEADLSEFNGGELDPDRVTNRVNRRLSQTALQRLGATQPEILKRLMGDHSDERGLWARYLFCLVDTPPAYLDFSNPGPPSKLTNTLANLHKKLEALPEQDYLLSKAAKPIFQDAYNHYRSIVYANNDSDLGGAAAAAKMGTYLSRLTLWLHLVNAALADTEPSPTITPETVEMAVQWTQFYWCQNQLLMARNAPTQELTGDLLKVWCYIDKIQLDDFLPSDISAKVKFRDEAKTRKEGKIRYKSSKYHSELLEQLVHLGYLTQSGKRFSKKSEDFETEAQNLESFQTPETPVSREIKPLESQRLEKLKEGSSFQNASPTTDGHSPSSDFEPLSNCELAELLGGEQS